jgi:hypothetical protein
LVVGALNMTDEFIEFLAFTNNIFVVAFAAEFVIKWTGIGTTR